MKPNTKRKKWPSYVDNKRGMLTEEYMAFLEEQSLCYKFVKMSSDLLSKPIILKLESPRTHGCVQPRTDGKIIWLPKMMRDIRISLKHELAHIYFKSNVVLRKVFVENMISHYFPFVNIITREKLVDNCCLLINIFDDVRVNYLWGALFPGDGEKLSKWEKEAANDQEKLWKKSRKVSGQDNLFAYAILVALGKDVQSLKWGKYYGRIKEVCDEVRILSFSGLLIVSREFLLEIINDLLEEDSTCPKSGAAPDKIDYDAMEKVAEELVASSPYQSPADLSHNIGYDTLDKKGQPEIVHSEKKNCKETRESLKKIENMCLMEDMEEMSLHLTQLRDDLQNTPIRGGDDITRSIKAKVNHKKISSAECRPIILTGEDRSTISRWRGLFQRIMNASIREMEMEGEVLNTEMFMQSRIFRTPLPSYERTISGKGFNLCILVDMSGSMKGNFQYVEKLCEVLKEATKFPFVKVNIIGFNSPAKGEVNIYEYDRSCKGLRSSEASPSGLTPISHAIDVSINLLRNREGESHIFLLSDGLPFYYLKDGRQANEASLISWTRSSVERAKKRRINTWCFMATSGYVRTDTMDKMFGPKFWKSIPLGDKMYTESFKFLTGQFIRFLRAR